MTELEQLKAEYELLSKEKDKVWEQFMNMAGEGIPYDVACKWYESQNVVEECAKLNRQIRILEDYELEPLPEYGTLMSLEEFIAYSKTGFLINYDGHGRYATSDQASNICVYPSDVMLDIYRHDFSHVIWFNR
jgi:hypothetical protein